MKQVQAWRGGLGVATDQVLYNLAERGIEWDLLPWCRGQGMPVMAYSPLESGTAEQRALLGNPGLAEVARKHGVTPAQVAVAWLLHQDGVVVIPKAVRLENVRANRAALDIRLDADDLGRLDAAFPPPRGPRPLAMR
jgi:diketogulonate reductase-like aldo/keto reductase